MESAGSSVDFSSFELDTANTARYNVINMNAREIAAEIVLIARDLLTRDLLTRDAYLRLRRSTLGLPRASRRELLEVFAEYESLTRANYTHGAIREWHLAMAGEPEAWITLFARDWEPVAV